MYMKNFINGFFPQRMPSVLPGKCMYKVTCTVF